MKNFPFYDELFKYFICMIMAKKGKRISFKKKNMVL